jgi:uncharacterized membrane protein YeaQ/YmgE (transglycosylase-associated protein family)
VPDYDLLKNLFNLNAGKAQLRKELNVIWCVGDDKPNKSLLPYLTQVCLYEYEVTESTTLPVWFKRGCILLNGSVTDVRQVLKSFNDIARKEQFTNSADQIFTTSEDDYNKQTNENKKIFDQQAACLCLMLRKEFGEVKLQGFLRLQSKNKPETVLGMIYGFKSYSQFDRQYVRYMKDLCAERPGDEPIGYLPTLGIGVAGSFVGGTINFLLGMGHQSFQTSGLIMSVLGGVVCCAAWRYYKLKTSLSGPKSFISGRVKD